MGILNSLTASSTAAYSLRKLLTAYAGSAIRVRESGGNTEADIGFDVNGDLDTSALLTHCGVNSGFIVNWYDQSGNGYNILQSNSTLQPQIVSGGTVLQDANGNPRIYHNGNYAYEITNIGTLTQPNTFSSVGQFDTATNIFQFDSGSFSGRHAHFIDNSSFAFFAGSTQKPVASDTNQHVWTLEFNTTSSKYWLDGTQQGTTYNVGTNSFINLRYGSTPNAGQKYIGYAQEFIIFNSALSTTDRETLEADQDAYWINPSAGATYTQSISNTVSSATSITKSTSKLISNTVSSVTSTIKSTTKIITNTVSAITSVLTSLISDVIYYVNISNTVSSATTITKSMTKIITNNVSSALSILKKTTKIIVNTVSCVIARVREGVIGVAKYIFKTKARLRNFTVKKIRTFFYRK